MARNFTVGPIIILSIQLIMQISHSKPIKDPKNSICEHPKSVRRFAKS